MRGSELRKLSTKFTYSEFLQINGNHSLKLSLQEGFIDYKARKRRGGSVAYFNFDLAKTMGLISKEHPCNLTEDLATAILETFSIVIINEYDLIHKIKYPENEILPNMYMATRYLQLQHPNKQGKESGDGRSIWNGEFQSNGITWDISSCGTGATKLSPATEIKQKFFKTGDPKVSYGNGRAGFDEGLSALFMSEVFKQNKIETEQVLAIIEFKDGTAINVRAHESLLRPSHFFCYIKQGNYENLKKIVDYYIKRQEDNRLWLNVPTKDVDRYRYFLDRITEVFSKTAAKFEDEYIFCWLDWDGDNILMDGGIIDYGSVRQFGLCHHEYRYDDVQKVSTSIVEQKQKAKYIVQTFAQGIDFLISKERKNIHFFNNCKANSNYEKIFEQEKNLSLLKKIGLPDEYVEFMATKHKKLVENFRKHFNYFEKAKSKKGLYEVPDGITWDAVFCMRDILREFPQLYLARKEYLSDDDFIEIIRSSYAKDEDLQLNTYRKMHILDFQVTYLSILKAISNHFDFSIDDILLEVSIRSQVINKYDRITGDSITYIVEKIMKERPKLNVEEINSILRNFIAFQNFDPNKKMKPPHLEEKHKKLLFKVMELVRDLREGI